MLLSGTRNLGGIVSDQSALVDEMMAEMEQAAERYNDLILLTEWMARNDWPASEIAEAVRRPAKYAEQLTEARIALDLADVMQS
jgi:hypothetical protein